MSKQLTADLATTPVSPIVFKTTNVNPPSNLFVTREDVLVITSVNAAAGVTLTVRGRIMRNDSKVIPFSQDHAPNTNRTSATTIIPIGEGFLLDVAVFQTAGSAKRGQCYVQLTLGRGDLAARLDFQVILQGYVGNNVNQAWPGNRLEQPTEGPGFIRFVTGTMPAAGADISETVPTGARWRLVSFLASLTTAVAVANRQVVFRADNGVSAFTQSATPETQPASILYTHVFAPGVALASAPSATNPLAGLPTYLMLSAGFRMQTVTALLQAADQWAAPQYCVEEWIEP